MRCKEVNQNGVTHYYYVCDQCGKKFYKQMYQPVYTLKNSFGKGNLEFCCYQCKADYQKALTAKQNKELEIINDKSLEEQLRYLSKNGYSYLDIACKLNLTITKVRTLMSKYGIRKNEVRDNG
jgi:hypothetical protein